MRFPDRTDTILYKILNLLPAIGSPKLVGNLGSLQNIADNGQEIVLAEAKLSDPKKPTPMTVMVHDPTRINALPANTYSLQIRIQFGTGGIQFDTGFYNIGTGFSTSMCADWARLSARCFDLAPPGPGTITPIRGAISLGAIPRNLPPLQFSEQFIALAAAAASAETSIPLFARGLYITAFPANAFTLSIFTSAGNRLARRDIDFAAGEKTGWIPITDGLSFLITNNGGVPSTFTYTFGIEF